MPDAAIYAIEHIVSGRRYVGGTNSWKRRRGEHASELRGGRHCNAHLQKAWAKYGEEAFQFIVLEHLDTVELIVEREQHWIEQTSDAYNICPAAGTRRGVPHTPEHIARIRMAKLGQRHSDLTRARIREKRAMQVMDPAAMAKTRAANRGLKRSPEQRAALSAALTGKTLSRETRAKLAAANLGKRYSEETKAKKSVSMRAFWAKRKAAMVDVGAGQP